MAHNSNSADLKLKFQHYHLNHYFIQLNETHLKNLKKSSKTPAPSVIQHHAAMLADKHIIDITFLSRNGEYKANLERYANCVKLGSRDTLTSYLQSLQDNEEAQKQANYLQYLLNPSKDATPVIYEPYSITNGIKNTISAVNNPRLDHAVWSRNLTEILIVFLGVSTPQLSQLCKAVALCNGFASYGFYVLRGGLDAVCGIKNLVHTDKYEKAGITAEDQFKFQAEQRYQRFTNDILLWAPVNLLTFHYLVGPGQLGMVGNLLTVALLVGDLCLAAYGYYHKVKQFELISEEIKRQRDDNDHASQKYQELNEHLIALTKIHEKDLEQLRYQLFYQVALVVAFSVLLINTVPCMLGSLMTIFILQLFLNVKDLYLQWRDEEDKDERTILIFQMFMKLFEHLMIPGLFIAVGLLVMPLIPAMSPFLVFAVCAMMTVNLLQLTNYITNLFASYMRDGQLNMGKISLDFNKYVALPAMMMGVLFASTATLIHTVPAGVLLVGLFFLSNTMVQLGEKMWNHFNEPESSLKIKVA
jgi:hypothetical protein